MKAFLSHSSRDKEFVRKVSEELGRQFCVIDEKAFENGKDFKKSIEEGLDDSKLFVLFATKDSLASMWVDFEISEAWYRLLEKNLSKALVYILDDSSHSAVPKWLQRAKIGKANAPKVVAREIREHLDELLREKQQTFFIGRSADVEQLQRTLSPIDGSAPPHVMTIVGLPSIGRRTLIRRSCKDLLNLARIIEFRIQDGDSLQDIAIKIADAVEPYSTAAGLERIVTEIKNASENELLQRILQNFRTCVSNQELPVFYDNGGLLDAEGRFSAPILRVLNTLSPEDDIYLVLITPRRPNQDRTDPIPILQIQPLRKDDSKILVAAIANQAGLRLKAGEISELADYVGGFPPASYYAIQLAKDYGLPSVLADKNRLVEFRTSTFIKYLTAKKLSENQNRILRVLAEYSPLPLPVLGSILSLDAENLSKTLVTLADYSLIYADIHGLYWLAEPVRDAVAKTEKFLTKAEHLSVATAVSEQLKLENGAEPRLELSRVLFRAATQARASRLADTAFHIANDIIQLTEHHYHSRDYESAVKFAQDAVVLRPDSFKARSYLVRALIQEERWAEAKAEIEKLNGVAPVRDAYFLQGFLARKQRNIDDAIRLFEMAEKAGRNDVAVKRELAWCFFIKKDYAKSAKSLEDILTDHGENNFVIDLSVQLATKMKDETAARQRLRQLAAIDSSGFYFHRLSTVESFFGDIDAAHKASLQAVQLEERPSFEMLGQLALCEIKRGLVDDAEGRLADLDKQFHRIRQDVRLNLRGRLELARKRYKAAFELSEKNTKRDDKFYKDVRRQALEGLLSGALNDSVRNAYLKELKQLNEELKTIDRAELEIIE